MLPQLIYLFHNSIFRVCCIGLIVLGLHSASPSYGQSLRPSTQNADYILIIDNSDSILEEEDKQLMRLAVKMFVNVLNEGDKLAVITFNKNAKVIFNDEIGPQSQRQEIEFVATSNVLDFSVDESNITAAFEEAVDIKDLFWRESGRSNQKVIILVSDGQLFLQPVEAIPDQYDRLISLVNNHFGDATIHALEVQTAESGSPIRGVAGSVTGNDLLNMLVGEEGGNLSLVEKPEDVLAEYIDVIGKSLRTKSLSNNTGALNINETVREFKLILLKRLDDRARRRPENIRIVFGAQEPFEIEYESDFEEGKRIQYGLNVTWNRGLDFDVVTINTSGYRWAANQRIMPVTFKGIDPEVVYHRDIEQLGIISPVIRSVARGDSVFLTEHPAIIGMRIFEEDPSLNEVKARDNFITNAEAFMQINPIDFQGDVDVYEHQLNFSKKDQLFYYDLHELNEELTPGVYKVSFHALLNDYNGATKYLNNTRIEIKKDYIQPQLPPDLNVSDREPVDVEVGLTIDRSEGSTYGLDFDENTPPTRVQARIFELPDRELQLIPLELVSSNEDALTFSGAITLEEAVSPLVEFVLTGSKNGTAHIVKTRPYTLGNITTSLFTRVQIGLMYLGIGLLGILLMTRVNLWVRPSFSFRLFMTNTRYYPTKKWKEELRFSTKTEHIVGGTVRTEESNKVHRAKLYSGIFSDRRYCKNIDGSIRLLRKGKRNPVPIKRGASRLIKDDDEIMFGNDDYRYRIMFAAKKKPMAATRT